MKTVTRRAGFAILIAMLVILFLAMLPTHLIEVENPFVESQTHIVFPDPSIPTEVAR